MSSPKVPSELTDNIIDYFCEDMHALAKCSTVCKAWLTRSRYHHFRHISLSYTLRHHTNSFIALCDSSLSTITPYIRSVCLVESKAPADRWIYDTAARLTMFGDVESLTLKDAIFPLSEIVAGTTLFSKFPKLKRLHLLGAYFRSFSQLVDIVGACPHLEHIELDGMNYWNRVEIPIDQQPPRRLEKLELGLCDKVAVIDWLIADQAVLRLTTLCATCLALGEISSIGALLRTLAPSLEHLELGSDINSSCDPSDYRDEMHHHIDLSSHSCLRTINFTESVSALQGTWSSWIPAILSQISGSCIEELVFQLVVPDAQSLKTFNWDALADILVPSSFPKLRTIRIIPRNIEHLTYVNDDPEVMGLITHKMSTWIALGILSL